MIIGALTPILLSTEVYLSVRHFATGGVIVSVIRYILIAASLLLAASVAIGEDELGLESDAAHLFYGLAAGFSPALFGYVAAVMTRSVQRWRGQPDNFSANWNWAWGLLLVIAFAVRAFEFTSPDY